MATPPPPPPNMDVLAVSIASRLPDFWTKEPKLWFIQVEAVLAPQNMSDENKYQMVVAKLGQEVMKQVSDIVSSPSAANKYQALKARLLTVYEESQTRQFEKLIGELELGDQKPSALLRTMKELGTGKVETGALKMIWLRRLPSYVRAVLAVSNETDLDKMALVADKIMETSKPIEVSEVQSNASNPSCSGSRADADLQKQIAQLTKKIEMLQSNRRGRNRNRSQSRFRGRSRSRGKSQGPKRTPDSPNWLCRHHYRYKKRATKCEQPCAWKTEN